MSSPIGRTSSTRPILVGGRPGKGFHLSLADVLRLAPEINRKTIVAAVAAKSLRGYPAARGCGWALPSHGVTKWLETIGVDTTRLVQFIADLEEESARSLPTIYFNYREAEAKRAARADRKAARKAAEQRSASHGQT